MDNKLDQILLIDDDYATNIFHKVIFEELRLDNKILVQNSAEEAMKMLLKKDCVPDIIFMDLNMPRVNGWEFIEQLEKHGLSHFKLVILTSSINPKDEERAAQYPNVISYLKKPLNVGNIMRVIKSCWPKYRFDA